VRGLARRTAWILGWPARSALLVLIGLYRLTLGQVLGGNCRFSPSCSVYAQEAIAEWGAVRGSALAVWRILRCSPLSRGGVDRPPVRRNLYDDDIHAATDRPARSEAA
jgi:uncharacterized protein